LRGLGLLFTKKGRFLASFFVAWLLFPVTPGAFFLAMPEEKIDIFVKIHDNNQQNLR